MKEFKDFCKKKDKGLCKKEKILKLKRMKIKEMIKQIKGKRLS